MSSLDQAASREAREHDERAGRRRLLLGLAGVGAACWLPARSVVANDDGMARPLADEWHAPGGERVGGTLNRLVSGSARVRADHYPRASVRLMACAQITREVRLVAEAKSWPEELDGGVFTVTDPMIRGAAVASADKLSPLRREAVLERLEWISVKTRLRVYVAFSAEEGVYIDPAGERRARRRGTN